MPTTGPAPFRRSAEPNISSSSAAVAARRRSRSASGTLSSHLTEERLRDDARGGGGRGCSNISPNSRRLSDSGLYLWSIGGHSPDRESFGSAASSASSFSSTVLDKIHHWGTSCFPNRRDHHAAAKTPPLYPRRASWDLGLPEGGPRDLGSKGSSVVRLAGKSLRESDLIPSDPVVGTMATSPVGASELSIGTVIETSEDSFGVMCAGSEDRQYEWAFKHKPMALKDFICNGDRAEELRELVTKGQCSHFIFEGPPGVGKRTMVLAFLRETFGPEKMKTKNELKKIELKGEPVTSIDVNVKISSQHVEVNLSEVCGYEKHVIVALINDFHTPLDKAAPCDHTNSRVIVLHEAEKLSRDAQHYVRWLMEKYTGCNRIFFCCYDASKLHTIKHLCKIVKLQPPSNDEIVEVLEFIAKKEQIELPHHLAEKITANSEHNLRQAIRSFEASWKSNYSFKENQEILTGWEDDIAKIAKNTIEEQSPKQLYIIRGELKKLAEHNVSPDFVSSTLVVELKKHLDERFRAKLDALYQEYKIRDDRSLFDESVSFSSDTKKNIHRFMRIEEFTAKFMSKYKSAITKNAANWY